jgi:carboxylesterase
MLRKGDNSIACLLLHGFTGSPAEMEGLAAFLFQQHCTVAVPTLPGHATQPEDLRRISYQRWLEASENALRDLQQNYSNIFVIGQSMGGTLALHLAAHFHFAGVVTLAAALRLPWAQEIASYILAPFVPTRYKPNGSDVNDCNGKAQLNNYNCYPMAAVRQLMRLLRKVRAELPAVTTPLLAIHSPADHVVPFDNLGLLMREVNSARREQMIVENSYHVLTVDYDREVIFEKIWAFIQQQSPSS